MILRILLALLLVIGVAQRKQAIAADANPKRLLLISQGPDGHPPGSHEYAAGQKVLAQLLHDLPGLKVETTVADGEWGEGPELLAKVDGVVLFLSEGGKWLNSDGRRREAFARLAERGGGITGLHWGVGTKDAENIDTCLKLLGACHGGPDRKYKVLSTKVQIVAKDHPACAGLADFTIHDEFYYQLKRVPGDTKGFTPLLSIDVEGKQETVSWAWERPDGGRSFGLTGGHFQENWHREEYQRLLTQGILWSLKMSPTQGFVLAKVAPEPTVRVTGEIMDAQTGKPVAARVYLQADSGKWYFPQSSAKEGSAIPFQREYLATQSVEMHTTLSAHPWMVDLPPGEYTLTVERGKEYLPVVQRFTVEKKEVELKVELSRWIDMTNRGWYSGDTHIHHELAAVPNLILAEDINIAFPLSYWVTTADSDPIQGNRAKGTGAKGEVIRVAENHLIYPMNTEYEIFTVGGKPHTLGAFVIVGHKTPFNLATPPVTPIAEWAHREGGLIDLEKHSWPWSVAIVPVMKVDLFELANNHCWRTEFGFQRWTIDAAGEYMKLEREERGLTEWGWIDFGFQTYYALLNCGFRLQPTAGTAAGVHAVPLGFGRVYVHQPDGFGYEKWLQALQRGESFVTTGPMLEATVNGKRSGHVFQTDQADGAYEVAGTVSSTVPLDRIEILMNGQVAETIREPGAKTELGGYEVKFQSRVELKTSGWIAVRCFTADPKKRVRFAHTAPWHVEVKGRPVLPRQEEIDYLIGRCREEIERNRSVLGPAAMKEFEQALAFYLALAERIKPRP